MYESMCPRRYIRSTRIRRETHPDSGPCLCVLDACSGFRPLASRIASVPASEAGQCRSVFSHAIALSRDLCCQLIDLVGQILDPTLGVYVESIENLNRIVIRVL